MADKTDASPLLEAMGSDKTMTASGEQDSMHIRTSSSRAAVAPFGGDGTAETEDQHHSSSSSSSSSSSDSDEPETIWCYTELNPDGLSGWNSDEDTDRSEITHLSASFTLDLHYGNSSARDFAFDSRRLSELAEEFPSVEVLRIQLDFSGDRLAGASARRTRSLTQFLIDDVLGEVLDAVGWERAVKVYVVVTDAGTSGIASGQVMDGTGLVKAQVAARLLSHLGGSVYIGDSAARSDVV